MARLNELTPMFVEFIPEQLEQGVLYISREYGTAIHLCVCGCGQQTVTPIGKPHGWQMIETDGLVTLSPSIGNSAFDCRSHYFIRKNHVIWL